MLFFPLCGIAGEVSKVNPWGSFLTPAPGPAASIGSYSAGCLRGAELLPSDGDGYQGIRLERARHFGHPDLITWLKSLGKEVRNAGEPSILIGDIGLPRGGPTLSQHSSHQVGLDVDVWFWRSGKKLSSRDRESFNAPSMIRAKELRVNSKQFGTPQVSILKRVSGSEQVDRILVNFAIKKELCTRFPNEAWIRKVRPWFGHDRHFHVRLKCPSGSLECKPTDAIPPGNGCDETLAWWGSDEARAEEKKKSDSEPQMPTLPTACEALKS